MSFDPLAAAKKLAPLIREGAAEGDRERRLPERVATAMAEAGLYRLSVAKDLGGYEADPHTLMRAIEAVSEADGAAGWNLMIGLETGGIASGAMTPEAGREVYGANPNAIMSGAVRASSKSTRVPGGWRLTGRWPYASGIHNANWFWGGSMLHDVDGEPLRDANGLPRQGQMIIPKSEIEIIDTWQVAGLRGSGSHDAAVHDVFIPDHMWTDMNARPRQQTPLFTYPIVSRLCFTKVGVATGIARAAITSFTELATRKTPFLSQNLLRERAHAQLAVAEAECLLSSGRAFVFEAVGQMWRTVCADERPSPELRIRQRLAASYCVDAAVRAVEIVYKAAGASPNFLESPMERQMRDVHVVAAHVTVAPAVFETAGRAILGLEVAPGSF